MSDPTHYQYRLKCIRCQLHFIVCTWDEDWYLGKMDRAPHCPECASTGPYVVYRHDSDLQIFEVVPGPFGEIVNVG